MIARKLVLLSFSALLLGAPGARAQPGKKAEDKARARAAVLFEEAKGNYNIREYEKALSGFKEAYLLAREPVLILNIGQCYRYLGRYWEAGDTFQIYLQEDPRTPYRAQVEHLIAEMKEKQAELEAASQPAPAPATSLPAAAPAEEARAPKILYGMTAAAFALGLGSGGLAVVLATRSEELAAQNDGVGAVLAEERSNRFGVGAAVLVGAGVAAGVSSLLLYRRSRQERPAFEPILE
jgi:tetratricopeptide (TPR) repeat protein